MSGLTRVLTASEPWAEYQLEDGTLLRFRFTACSFRRTGQLTAQGDPEYQFSHQVQCETHARPVAAEVRQLPRLVGADNGMPSDSPYQAPAEDCG